MKTYIQAIIGIVLLAFIAYISSSSKIEMIAVVAEVLCIWYLAKEKPITFAFGIISTSLFFYLFLQTHIYASMMAQFYFFSMNIIGFYLWTRQKEEGVKIRKTTCINKKEKIILSAMVITLV